MKFHTQIQAGSSNESLCIIFNIYEIWYNTIVSNYLLVVYLL